ncbi:Insulin-like growth factor binding protein, N-terminal [Pseudocohnilembus persalinus]|uniref:Insulin-like growth factor binding protein, N-terminal n=1 Tax=Pseudocohnilembus persalinus TaxID=266149 RepID=A0A0V0Q8H3_PSEPJ|nr:Insulin-like growth factor binding protein, N-terminal [Pseudocohnilembus persalinus]|eukprot:KRW98540.1 Insulin-like growth factor binding protein, N-terminal [Pseudocohnilembus persalinus]
MSVLIQFFAIQGTFQNKVSRIFYVEQAHYQIGILLTQKFLYSPDVSIDNVQLKINNEEIFKVKLNQYGFGNVYRQNCQDMPNRVNQLYFNRYGPDINNCLTCPQGSQLNGGICICNQQQIFEQLRCVDSCQGNGIDGESFVEVRADGNLLLNYTRQEANEDICGGPNLDNKEIYFDKIITQKLIFAHTSQSLNLNFTVYNINFWENFFAVREILIYSTNFYTCKEFKNQLNDSCKVCIGSQNDIFGRELPDCTCKNQMISQFPQNDDCVCPQNQLIFINNNKICDCDEGYYYDSEQLMCQRCHYKCKTCSDYDICLKCLNDKFEPPYCVDNHSYYKEINGKIQKYSCANGCQTCISRTECKTCVQGNNRQQIEQNCQCQQGYHDYDGTTKNCYKCPNNCLDCINDLQCTQCNDEKNLQLNVYKIKCECEKGYKYDELEQKCRKCYIYQNHKNCYFKCPKNTFLNENYSVCENYTLKQYMKTYYKYGGIVILWYLICFAVFIIMFNRLLKKLKKIKEKRQRQQRRTYNQIQDLNQINRNSQYLPNTLQNVNDSILEV